MSSACAAIALAACSGAISPSWEDPTPQARVGAIERSVRTGRTLQDAPHLVENLASDDASVRLAAITALERATGSTLGFRFDDSSAGRASSVARWRAWLDAYWVPGG